VARALVAGPRLVLADEPTGNLDEQAARSVLALLRALHERFGQTFVLVTHDPKAASVAGRVIRLEKGRVISDAPTDLPVASEAPRSRDSSPTSSSPACARGPARC